MKLETWGEGLWGDGYWGIEYINIIEDDRNIADATREWDIPPTIQEDTNNYALLNALITSLDDVDDSLERIYSGHHINTAAGDDLDKIGTFVGVSRETAESNSRYRTRIKARFRAGTIEPTTDNFAEYVTAILDTSEENFVLIRQDFIPEVIVSAQSGVWENNDLTAETLIDLLDNAVPAGHSVAVQERGTFRLKVDGEVDDPDQGLTSDSIETGGTLAANLL